MRRLIAIIAALVLAVATLGIAPTPSAEAHYPVDYKRSYVSQRFHRGHRGMDFAAPAGKRVRSAGAGVTVFAGWRRNCGGYQVYVRHGGGLYTAYYHLRKEVSYRGERISRGETLGYVGMTGVPPKGIRMRCATGPHLHLELWRGYPWRRGSYRINPWSFVMHRSNNPLLPSRYR